MPSTQTAFCQVHRVINSMTNLFHQDLVLREQLLRFELVEYDTVFATRSAKSSSVRKASLKLLGPSEPDLLSVLKLEKDSVQLLGQFQVVDFSS